MRVSSEARGRGRARMAAKQRRPRELVGVWVAGAGRRLWRPVRVAAADRRAAAAAVAPGPGRRTVLRRIRIKTLRLPLVAGGFRFRALPGFAGLRPVRVAAADRRAAAAAVAPGPGRRNFLRRIRIKTLRLPLVSGSQAGALRRLADAGGVCFWTVWFRAAVLFRLCGCRRPAGCGGGATRSGGRRRAGSGTV